MDSTQAVSPLEKHRLSRGTAWVCVMAPSRVSRAAGAPRRGRSMLRSPAVLLHTVVLLAVVVGQACASAGAGSPDPGRARRDAVGSNKVSLSQVDVLLPACGATDPTEFVLEAQNGCFTWTSTKPDIVSVTPLFENADEPTCSTSVLLSAATSVARRETAVIVAQEVHRGLILRCDVFVDQITSINLLTTTRQLYVDELEMIEVQAYDREGNRFSTLSGNTFSWKLDQKDILQIVPFKDAPVRTSWYTEERERSGRDSEAILVLGRDTGRVEISASLHEPGCGDAIAAAAVMSVLEPFQLFPYTPVRLAPHAELVYVLQRIQLNQMHVVPMPNAKYEWTSTNTTVGAVDATGRFVAKEPGTSVVSVHDVNMRDNRVAADLAVARPAYIILTTSPYNVSEQSPCTLPGAVVGHGVQSSVQLQHKDVYQVVVHVFDRAGHELTVTDNMVFELDVPSPALEVISASENHATTVVRATEPSAVSDAPVRLQARFTHFLVSGTGKKLPAAPVLATEQGVTVRPRLAVTPGPDLRLMWDVGAKATAKLTPSGGSGDYTFSSVDSTLATVSVRGLVTPHARGRTVIRVADRRICNAYLDLPTSITPPSGLRMLPGAVETPLGTSLPLSLVPLDADGRAFTAAACSAVQWAVDDLHVFQLDSDASATGTLPSPSATAGVCSTQLIRPLKEGSATATAKYGGLDARAVIASFPPLRPVFPPPDLPLVLALGATGNVSFVGGPLPWVLEPASHVINVAASDRRVLRVTPLDRSRYAVVCLVAEGDAAVSVLVGARPTPSNPHPINATLSLPVACRLPRSLSVLPAATADPSVTGTAAASTAAATTGDIGIASASASAAAASGMQATYHVRNDRPIAFQLRVADGDGRGFHNASSLAVSWTSSDPKAVRVDRAQLHHPSDPLQAVYLRQLHLLASSGSVHVHVGVEGFDAAVLSSVRVAKPKAAAGDASAAAFPALSHDLNLILMANVGLVPADSLLFNHANNTLRLNTTSGSGQYRFVCNNTDVLALSHDATAYATVTPLQVGVAGVRVSDVGLQAATDADAVVRVADAAFLEIRGPEHCLLGTSVTLQVVVRAPDRRVFPRDQHEFMSLTLVPDFDGISVTRVSDGYRVACTHTSSGGVSASVILRDGTTVSSAVKPLSVYPPLTCVPSSLLLAPGASYQLSCRGGTDFAALSYTSSHAALAKVTAGDGIVTAFATGDVHITVVARGHDRSVGKEVVFARLDVPLRVHTPAGFTLGCPARPVFAGRSVTVALLGSAGETPLQYATPDLTYAWASTDARVADVTPALLPTLAPSYAATVHALAPGKTTISVDVAGERAAACTIMVRRPIALLPSSAPLSSAPMPDDAADEASTLLLYPGARSRIRTTYDATHRLAYRVLSPASVLRVDASGEVTAPAECSVHYVLVEAQSADAADAVDSLVVRVVVRRVAFLSVQPNSERSATALAQLSVQSRFSLVILLHDEYGNVFAPEAGAAFDLTVSHGNRVAVTPSQQRNGTIAVAALLRGDVSVAVALRGSAIRTFFPLRVASEIRPTSPVVHVGAELLLTALNSRPSAAAVFTSSNSAVLSVGPAPASGSGDDVRASARAVAEAPGVAVVTLGADSTPVHVVEVDGVEVERVVPPGAADDVPHRHHNHPLTNVPTRVATANAPEPNNEYVFRVSFFGPQAEPLVSSAYVDQMIDWRCRFEPSELGNAHADLVLDGVPGCVVTVYAPLRADAPFATSVELIVEAGAADGHMVRHVETLPFASAFTVLQRPDVLVVSDAERTVRISVQGAADQIVASSSDASRVKVSQHVRSATLLDVDVSVPAGVGPFFHDVRVALLNHETQQHDSIPIAWRNLPASSSSSSTSSSTGSGGWIGAGSAVTATATSPPASASVLVSVLSAVPWTALLTTLGAGVVALRVLAWINANAAPRPPVAVSPSPTPSSAGASVFPSSAMSPSPLSPFHASQGAPHTAPQHRRGIFPSPSPGTGYSRRTAPAAADSPYRAGRVGYPIY